MRQDERIDELVPAPWSLGRRITIGVVAATVVGVLVAVWWAGAITPRLAAESAGGDWQPGALIEERVTDVDVSVHLHVINRGRFDVAVDGWRPPGTEGIEWSDEVAGLPVELAPGERAEMTVRAHVPDCGRVHVGDGQTLDLRGHALVPISHRRSVRIPAAYSAPPWRYREERHQALAGDDPSWIYDALAWPCDPEVEGETG